jgi:hypothetical protein
MAQVNSEPGKNQAAANTAVTAQLTTQTNPNPGVNPGNQYSLTITVPYVQAEAGWPENHGGIKPKRS